MKNIVNLHGVFMNIFNIGTLITGEPGTGKSELALSLINRGHQLIADDAPLIYKTTANALIGASSENLQDLLEVRSLGILNIRKLFGSEAIAKTGELKLIIHLEKQQKALQDNERLNGCYSIRKILAIDVPQMTLSPEPNRDLLTLSECAVRQQLCCHPEQSEGSYYLDSSLRSE